MLSCTRPCGCSHRSSMEDGRCSGVRSYLHLFYEDCAGTALSDDPEGPPVLCPRRPWPSLCWKISLSSGTLLLLLGVAALTTGYAVPPKLESVTFSEAPILDQRAADYNQALGTCRLAGTALCVAAGILLAICLFWAMTGWLSQDTKAEPVDTEADSHVEVFRDEPPPPLSPIFRDASGRSWLSALAATLGSLCRPSSPHGTCELPAWQLQEAPEPSLLPTTPSLSMSPQHLPVNGAPAS